MADASCTDWLIQVAEHHGAASQLRKTRQIAALKSWRKRQDSPRPSAVKVKKACLKAQVRWINTRQRKADHQLPAALAAVRGRPLVSKSALRGQGKWKHSIPEQVQRDVFTSGTKSFRARSGDDANHTHIINLTYGCSLKLLELESGAIVSFLQTCHFCVFQFICDTASYRFLYAKHRGKATDTHLLGLHGRLLGGSVSLDVREDEFVARPAALQANSAACHWSGFEAQMPLDLFNLLNGRLPPHIRMVALCMGADEHSVNKMILARLQEIASTNDRLLVVPGGWCKQHGTGNILQPAITKLGIFSPAYCCSKRMRLDTFYTAFLAGVKAELHSMTWIRKSEQPDWHPDEDNVRYATEIMALAYHRKRLAFTSNPEGDAATHDLEVDERTEQAAEFVRKFPGDWRAGQIIYYEYTNESESREDAVDRAFKDLCEIGFHVLGDPAQNKWFTVWQLLNNLVLMMAFHKVFVRAWRRASKVSDEESEMCEGLSDFSESEKLGIESAEAWHRRERRRDLKVLQWVEHRTSLFKVLLFLYVSSKVTALHFFFFKYGHVAPYGTDPSCVFDLCDDARSRPVSILAELMGLLRPSAEWGVLTMKFGEFSTWPGLWKRLAWEVVLGLAGGLKHRLIDPFRKPPFTTWVRLADPKLTEYEKRLAANHLFDVDERTLDESSLKIRKVSGSARQLLDDPFWMVFLFHAANKISLSSAFVECMFAAFKQWFRCSPKPLSLANLSARYIPVAFSSANARKHKRMGFDTKSSMNCRPAWVLKKGDGNRSSPWGAHWGVHMGARIANGLTKKEAIQAASDSYKTVSAVAKASAKANAIRVKAMHDDRKLDQLSRVGTVATDLPSIWDTSRGGECPLHVNDIKEQLYDRVGGVKDAALEWTRSICNTPLGRHPNFPGEVSYRLPLSLVESGMGEANVAFAADVINDLRVLFAPRGITTDIYRPLCIKSSCGLQCILQCCWVLKNPDFVGQCLFYCLHDQEIWCDVPLELSATFAISASGLESIVTFSDLAARLADVATAPLTYQHIEIDWAMSGKGRIHFKEFGMPIDIDVAREDNLAHARSVKALRLYNAALTPWHAQPKRRKAVAVRRKRSHDDDGKDPEDDEEEEPQEIVWKEAESDQSDAETDHGLDDEFNAPRNKDGVYICHVNFT